MKTIERTKHPQPPLPYPPLSTFNSNLGVPPNGVRLSATMLLFVPHKSIFAASRAMRIALLL
ncbi:hypothetical protein EZS27_018148 [termite gut metagenome]|uniref:Uncharacterized protein n=1 Tax=termite gut metagenome TaxID=433724 RepID=A0A5J4RJB3_9ZZZZ